MTLGTLRRQVPSLSAIFVLALAPAVLAQGLGQANRFYCGEPHAQSIATAPGKRAVVAMSFGGVRPDVPWFLAPGVAAGYTPGVPSSPHAANAPYAVPTAASIVAGDNPALASAPITHANITRFWANNGAGVSYRVYLPPGATPASKVSASFGPTLAPAQFGATGSAAESYTWQQWINAVNAAFAKYNNCGTSAVSIANGGTFTGPDFRLAAGSMPAITPTQFIWSAQNAVPGPTGNAANDIILTDQTNLSGGIGYCSMLVDPATGIIDECDVLLSVDRLFNVGPSGATNTNGTLPDDWTALTHEIGHFFGLDHTNLHAGVTGPSGGSVAAPASYVDNSSLADYPAGLLLPAATGLPFPYAAIPGMSGVITYVGPFPAGSVPANYNATPLHGDDATGLSKLYPVAMPTLGSPKIPLINASARIIGRHDYHDPSANGFAVFGRNVYAHFEGASGSTFPFRFPINGTVTGTARLSRTDGFILNDAVVSVRPFAHPNSLGSPTWSSNLLYPQATSVVGGRPLPGQAGAGPTGDYSIDGLLPGSLAAPLAYELVIEDSIELGVNNATLFAPNPANPNLAEWFSAAPTLYAGNFLTTSSPFYNPTTGPVAIPPVRMSNAIANLVAGYTLTPQTGGLPTVGFWNFAASWNDSAMRVVAGTVIAIDPREHDESRFSGTGSIQSRPFGPAFNDVVEYYSRPLVDVQPRDGRLNPQAGGAPYANMTVTAQCSGSSNVALPHLINPASIRIYVTVGGTTTLLTAATLPAAAVATNGKSAVWTIPMSTFTTGVPSTTPISVTVAVSEVDPTGSITPFLTFGRNDVVL